MDCDLASDLSKQVELLLPPLPEDTYSSDPSFMLTSNDIEGEEFIVPASNDIEGEEPSEEPREEILSPLPEDTPSVVLPNDDVQQDEELSNSRTSPDPATSQVNL